MKKINKKFLFLALLIIFLSSAFFAKAATKELEQSYPVFFGYSLTKDSTLGDLIMYIFILAISISGIAVFLSFLVAGAQWMTSSGNPGKMQAAKERMGSALFGLILLFGSYLILNKINPQLTNIAAPGGITGKNIPAIEGIDYKSLVGIMLLKESEEDGTVGPNYVLEVSNPLDDFEGESRGMITWSDGSSCPQNELENPIPLPLLSLIPVPNYNYGINDCAKFVIKGEFVNHSILCLRESYSWCGYFDESISDLEHIVTEDCSFGNPDCKAQNPASDKWSTGVSSAIVSEGAYGEPCQGVTVFADVNYGRKSNVEGGPITTIRPYGNFFGVNEADPKDIRCRRFNGSIILPLNYTSPPGDGLLAAVSSEFSCASSISVEGSCKFQLFEQVDCSGAATGVFYENIPNLGNIGWNDRAGCIKVAPAEWEESRWTGGSGGSH